MGFMRKIITGLLLVSTIFTSSIFTSVSSADSASSSETSAVERTNFQLVNDNLSNYEYTYEEGGIHYRIVENIDLEENYVSSEIYVKENGEYVLDSEVSSKLLEDNSMLVSTTKDGVIAKETIATGILEENQTEFSKVDGMSIPNSNGILLFANNDLTDWKFHSITRGSNFAERFTIGAISIIIGKIAPVPIAIAAQMANLYYQLNTQSVYWQKQWYYRYTLTDPPLPRAERVFTYFYTDSSYNNYVLDYPTMQETYTPGWGP